MVLSWASCDSTRWCVPAHADAGPSPGEPAAPRDARCTDREEVTEEACGWGCWVVRVVRAQIKPAHNQS